MMRVRTKRLAAVGFLLPNLTSHVTSWKRVSSEQQLDLSVFEHDQRDVTDEIRTPWKLPDEVASKNCLLFEHVPLNYCRELLL